MRWFRVTLRVVAALIHVCIFCGVRFSSPRTLQAHIANYCSRKPFSVPAGAASSSFNPTAAAAAAAAAASALAGALALPPPPPPSVLFAAHQPRPTHPGGPVTSSRDVIKHAPADGK